MTMQKTLRLTGHDGVTLAVDAWGDDSRPPVLLVHGGGQTRHAWGNTAAKLSEQGWYALSIDMRGHGDSDWHPEGKYAAVEFAEDLVAIAEQLPQPPVIVGASMGGIAGLLAQHRSQPFAALVLVDVTPTMSGGGVSRVVNFMLDRAEDGFESLEEAAEAVANYMPNRKPRSNNLEGLAKNLRLHDDGRYRWHWDPRFLNGRTDSRPETIVVDALVEAAQGLQIPTLLVRGRMSDLVTPEAAQHFLELVPHASFVDVKDAGHMIAGDKNDVFTRAVIEFLNDVRPGAAA